MGLTGRDRGGWRRAAGLGLALAFALLLLAAPPAARCEPAPVVLLALGGYDPVSYFLPEGPQPGAARYEAEWDGRVWRFAIEANRAAFRRDPAVYAPRLGGFDAAGILERRIVDADPTHFAILGGRLYLFRDAARRARFLADPSLAGAAEAIWPRLANLLEDPPGVPPQSGGQGDEPPAATEAPPPDAVGEAPRAPMPSRRSRE